MRLSRFHLATVKEAPADAEIVSHKLMLRAGMIRKLAAGIYTWSPLGLRVLRRVEAVVREEMNRAGAVELLMPSIQPQELGRNGRWEKLVASAEIRDRKDAGYCYGRPMKRWSRIRPTNEVLQAVARELLPDPDQVPRRDPAALRHHARTRISHEGCYSFHLDAPSLELEYRNMYDTYTRIFTRLGLRFRAVDADTGAIGGRPSHEFHVLAIRRGCDRVLLRLRLCGQCGESRGARTAC